MHPSNQVKDLRWLGEGSRPFAGLQALEGYDASHEIFGITLLRVTCCVSHASTRNGALLLVLS
jgi:hypothetical protein